MFLIPFLLYRFDFTHGRYHLERYLLCNEWQHRIVHGDRFGLRTTSLPSTDSCFSLVQRLLLPSNRPSRAREPFVQVSTLLIPKFTTNQDSLTNLP